MSLSNPHRGWMFDTLYTCLSITFLIQISLDLKYNLDYIIYMYVWISALFSSRSSILK